MKARLLSYSLIIALFFTICEEGYACPVCETPDAPTSGQSSISGNVVTLDWSDEVCDSYYVYLSCTNQNPDNYDQVEGPFQNSVCTSDDFEKGLEPGTLYYWRVRSHKDCDGGVFSLYSASWQFTTAGVPDTTPPDTDPMTWAVEPYASGSTAISMTATTASDPRGVEYYFQNLTITGHDSGWQDSPIYTDTGLDPDTSYYYKVRARDKACTPNYTSWSTEENTTTRASGDIWKFIVTGDSRNNDPGENNGVNITILGEIADEIVAQGVDLVLFPGDLVYGNGSTNQDELEDRFDTWISTLQPVYNAGIGVYPGRGNHDMLDGLPANRTAWNNAFGSSLPGNGPSGEEGVTYSFTHKNALFISLDEYITPNRVNQLWLNTQLSTNCVPHIFTFGHLPAFEVSHTDCLAINQTHAGHRDTFWDSLEGAGGRTYFCGHDHFYNHARLDDDGDWSNDIHQYIVGTAGAPIKTWSGLYNGLNSDYDVSNRHHANAWGYLLVEVDGLTTIVTWMKRISPGNYQAQYEWVYAAGIKDIDPPTPTPMTWVSKPMATGPYSISMTATTATDNCFAVEYFFEEISGNSGGSDSGWQDSPFYEDIGLSQGIGYTYRVKARDKSWSQNEGDWSISASAMIPLPPAAPSGLIASAVRGFPSWIKLSWMDNSSNAVGFKVQRSASSGGPWDPIGTADTDVRYYDVGLNSSDIYYYQVCAYNVGGDSGWSIEDYNSPCPSKPQGLIPTAGERKVDLDWDDNPATETDIEGYNVYRSTTHGGPYNKVNALLISQSAYSDGDLTDDTTYYYVVTAVDSLSNESGNSDEREATPQDQPPDAPTLLVATAGEGSVQLDWNYDPPSDFDHYHVYRSAVSGGPYEMIADDVSGKAHTDSVPSANAQNITYYYVVSAVDAGSNESLSYSNEDNASLTYYVRNLNRGIWYITIQLAIDNAMNNETIEASSGETYSESLQFTDKKITLTSSEPGIPASTKIDGGNTNTVITFNPGDADSTISGFTIQNGNATDGGGVYCDGASPTITGCVISDNDASNNGGGLYISDGSVTLTETVFKDNQANSGGAIYGNSGASVSIKDCTFGQSAHGNTAAQGGGALSGCSGSIQNSIIAYNSGGTGAGAISNSTVEILNSVIMENTGCDTQGPGLATALDNCDGDIVNCTIVSNTGGASITCSGLINCDGKIKNCIIWGNGDGTTDQLENCSTPTYCCIQDYSGAGTNGNISSDPSFDPDGYHLTNSSPCIDAGDSNNPPADDETDIDDDWRLRATSVDMGAHEYGKVIYVDNSIGTSGNGLSWNTPYKYLRDALNGTETPLDAGDEIWVANGTYYPDEDTTDSEGTDDRNATFHLAGKVAIYGGFAGGEDSIDERNLEQNETILSGDIDAEDWPPPEGETIYTGNSYHVVTGSDKSLLDGFTITKGYIEDTGPGGAGIYCVGTSPIIRNCTVTNNFAKYGRFGGGIYTTGTSSPKLINCLVAGNFAQMDDCGGIYHSGTGTLELINCTVVDNAFDGIHCDGANADILIQNCIVWQNRVDPDDTDSYPVREIVLLNGGKTEIVYSSVELGQDGVIDDSGTGLTWGAGNKSNDPQVREWGTWELQSANGNDLVAGTTSFDVDPTDVTIYDFKEQFAHMEKGSAHQEDNFIDDYLNSTQGHWNYGKPVLRDDMNPADKATITGDSGDESKFYLWYNSDVPGISDNAKWNGPINTNVDVSWVCRDPEKGIFKFNSVHFFPIDDWCSDPDYGCGGDSECKKFCNNQQNIECYDQSTHHPDETGTVKHNYFFTLMYDTNCTYIPGEILDFKGSDDLFVAINGVVLINRAGYYNPNPHETKLTFNSDGTVTVDFIFPARDPCTFGVDDGLVLEPYGMYDFKIFFAQRHTYMSVLSIERTPGDSDLIATFKPGDYHLTPGSLCIDAGDNTALPIIIDTDIESWPRFIDDPATNDSGNRDAEDPRPYVDMGAYELQVPIAVDDEYSISKNGVLNVAVPGGPPGVLDNDEDPLGDPIEAILESDPLHGSLTPTLNADGSFTYTPIPDYVGTDSFTYKAQSSDGRKSALATVTITVYMHLPNADAGPDQTLYVCNNDDSTSVTLDGSRSTDPENDIVSYKWDWTENDEPRSATGETIQVSMSADGGSPYEVLLTVKDSIEDEATDIVEITIEVLNPVADPGSDFEVVDGGAGDGDETVDAGADVTLDGSTSTGNGLTYIWYAGGEEIAQGPTPTVRLGIDTYTIGLLVIDECGRSDYKEVVVTVLWPHVGPQINAGETQEICLLFDGSEQLNGLDTLELDPDNIITKYEWKVIDVPDGGYVASWPEGKERLDPNVTLADGITGEYKFMLIGKDDAEQKIDTAVTSIIVKSCPGYNIGPEVTAWILVGDQEKKEHIITSPTPTVTVTLQGTITDDGQIFGELTSTWQQLRGAINGVQISPLTESCSGGCTNLEVTATATFTQEDTYMLSLKGDDGTKYDTDVVVVHFESGRLPHIDAGGNDLGDLDSGQVDVPMSDADVTDRDIPFDNTTQLWSLIDGDPANIEFLDVYGQPAGDTSTLENPTIRFTADGKYQFQLTANDPLVGDGVPDTVWVTIKEEPIVVQPRNCTALYAGVSNSDGTGDVYRKLDTSLSWVQISSPGTFSGPVLAFCNYNGNIHAGNKIGTSAAGVWRWDGLARWTKVTVDAWVESQGISQFYALTAYNGKLYAGTNVPNKLFTYEGGQWSVIEVTGHCSGIRSLYIWKGKLFLEANKTCNLGYYDSIWHELPGSCQPLNTNITFSEFSIGTNITDQYSDQGIVFGGDSPFITTDTANPTSPVLSGYPRFKGDIEGTFVDPQDGVSPIVICSLSLDAGWFDELGTTRIEWFGINNNKLGEQISSLIGIEHFDIEGYSISHWKISMTGDTKGYAIDNVEFSDDHKIIWDMQDYENTLFSGSFGGILLDLMVTEDAGGAITSFSSDSTDFGVSGNIWELEVFNDELYMCIDDTLYNPDVTVVGEDATVTLGAPIWVVPDGDDIISMLSTDSMLLIGTGIEASTNNSYDSHTGDIYTYNGSIFEPDGVVGSGVQCLILADVTCEPEHLTMPVRAYAEHSTAPSGWVDADNKCVSPEDFDADEIKYVITINPGGQPDAQGLVLTVMLPDCVDFVDADDPGAYDENSHGVIWLLDDIASDANPVIHTLIVKVNNSSVPDQSITTILSLENDNFQIIANDNTPTVCCWGEGKLYVDQGNTGLQNGRSWETALTSLSSALNYATDSDCYSEIWVAAGTHIPQGTGPAETFIIPDGISIYGGFAGTEKALNERDFRSTSNETVLSGEGVHDYVVTVEGVSTIDGFSIQGGLIAGVLSDSSSPTISHCWIGYNGSGTAGNAGIHLSGTSTGEIVNCVIYSNLGDGIYIDDTSSPFIRNNTIANNSLYGITNNGSGTPSIYNCLFWGNNSDGQQLDCTTYYCYIQGSTYTKANKDSNFNFGGDNPFDPDREYHLLWDVDCINEGLNELEGVWTIGNGATDIDGEARIVGGTVDIGADESPPIWLDAGDTIYEEIPVGASFLDVNFTSVEIKSNGGAPVPVNLSYQWSCIYYPDGYEPVFVSGTDSELYASATFISEGWYQFLLEVMDPDNGYTVVGADLLWVRIDMGVEIVVVGKDPVSGVSGEKSYEANINEILDLSAIFGPPSGPDHVEWRAPYVPVTIGESTDLNTDISFDTPGRYALELYALNSNYEAIGKDLVWIEVQNPQVKVSAGPDRVLYLEKNAVEVWEVSDEFHGSVEGINITSDDRVVWSVEAADDNADSDTVSVVYESPKVVNITFGHYGVYYVLFEAWKNTSHGEVFLGTGVAVTVVTYQQVELFAGDYPDTPDVSVTCGEPATFNLQGEVIQGQVDSYEWVFTDPEAPDGLVTFTSPQSLGTMVSFNAIGGYSGAGTYPITLLGKIHVDGEDLIAASNTVEITVEVTGSCGDDFIQAICISTSNTQPASPALPLTVEVEAEIEEDSCGSGIIFTDYDYAAWSWSGTDNSVIISQSDLSAPVAQVTFNSAGAYILTLVVKNGDDLIATTSHSITIDRCDITAEAGFDTNRTVKVLLVAIGDTNDLYGQVSNGCVDTPIDHYWSYEGSSDAVDLSPVDTELPIVQATATFNESGDYPITLCAVNAQTRELLAHETILAIVAPPLFWLDVSGSRITAPQAFPVDLPLTATILGGAPAGSTCYWSNAEPGGIPPDLSQPVASGTTVTYSFSSAGTYELSVTGNVSDPLWSQTATATVFVTEEITEVVCYAGRTKHVTLPKTAHMSDAVFVASDPDVVPKWSLDTGPADVTFLPNENSEKPYVMFSEEGHYTLSLVPWDLQTQAQLIDSEASIVDVFVYMPIVQNPDSPEVTLEKTDGSSNNLKILTATANDKDGVERLLMKLGDELLADASGYPSYYQDLELEHELDISHLPVGTSYFQAYAWDIANNMGQSEIACENNSAIRDFQVDPETINNTSGDYLIFTASFDGDPRDWTLDIFKADGSSVDSYTGEDDLKLEDGLPPVHTVDWSNGNYSATLTVTDTGDTGEVHFRILRGQVYSSQVIADLNSIVGEKSGENILKADYDVEEFYGGIGFESPLPVIKDRYCEVFATLGNADFPEDVKYRLSVGTIASSGIYSYFTPIQVITPSDVPRDEAGWAPKFSKGDAKMSLGTVDLSMLENGNYYLELFVSCNDAENSDYAQFILNCPLKIGNVKFSQEDLVIETGGIPLRVVRSYDSFRKHKDSEFGYGWTYSIANMEIELDENRTIMYETDFDLFEIGDETPVRLGGNLTQRNVTLTLPDGRRTTFMFYLEDAGKHGEIYPLYAAKYEAMPGIDASLRTLQEELLAVGFFNTYWQGVAEGPVGGVLIDPAQYDFSGYVLTTADGTEYYFEREDWTNGPEFFTYEWIDAYYTVVRGPLYLTRIKTVDDEEILLNTDLSNGKIGANGGIEHKDAQGTVTKSLKIAYNNDGRIGYINGPLEQGETLPGGTPTLIYDYDSEQGDLISVKKLVNKNGTTEDEKYDSTEYVYYYGHWLTDIIDERGLPPIRYFYDSAGRLTGVVDARGNHIIIEHDMAGNAEIVYERWDTEKRYPTTYAYNERGNVTLVQKNEVDEPDFLEKTEYFYDPYSAYPDSPREIRKFLPDDPGNPIVTQYDYDEDGKPLLIVDPENNVTETVYYDDGNLEWVIQGKNFTGTAGSPPYAYDIVSKTYNTYEGNKLKTMEACDTAGTRLRMTINIYDDRNRLVNTVQIDVQAMAPGDFPALYNLQDIANLPHSLKHTITAYSYSGNDLQPSYITNSAGASTYFSYDENGNQKASWYYWDDTSNNDYISIPNVIGYDSCVITLSEYDSQGRSIRTRRVVQAIANDANPPDPDIDSLLAGSDGEVLSEMKYNSLGKADFTIDQYNNVTKYEYDQIGNLVETRTFTTEAYDIGINAQGKIEEYFSDGTVDQEHEFWTNFETDADTSHLTTSQTLYDTEGRSLLTVGSFDPAVYDEVIFAEWPVGTETVYDVLGRVAETRRWAAVTVDLAPFKVVSGQSVLCEPDDTDMVGKMIPLGVYPEHAWDGTGTQPASIGWASEGILPVVMPSIAAEKIEDFVGPLSYSRTVYDSGGRVKHSVNLQEAIEDPANGEWIAAEQPTTYYYDMAGKQTIVIDPLGHDISNLTTKDIALYGYTPDEPVIAKYTDFTSFDDTEVTGNLTGTHKTVTEYDGTRRSAVTDARGNGNTTSFEYDALGRLEKTIHPDSVLYDMGSTAVPTYTHVGYDGLGRKKYQSETTREATRTVLGDADGLRWFYYDVAGRLTQVIMPKPKTADPDHPVYNYFYDDYGNQIAILDPLVRMTVFEYDESNHQTAKYMPFAFVDPTPSDGEIKVDDIYAALDTASPDVEYRDYDLHGRLEAHTDYKEQTTGYFYNKHGQLQYKRYYVFDGTVDGINQNYETDPENIWAEQTEYTYDTLGRRTTVEEKDNPNTYTRTTTYHYDAQGRVVQVDTDTPQGTINYGYNPITGRKTNTNTASGNTNTNYYYDELGRLAGTGTASENTYYHYDEVGNRKWLCVDADGGFDDSDPAAPTGYEIKTDYTYDPLNRLTDLLQQKTGQAGLSSYIYALKADGQRHSLDETLTRNETRNITYGYDDLNRLTDETATSSSNGYDIDYTYDLVGNRTLREITVNSQPLRTEYAYYPNSDLLETERQCGATCALDVGDDRYYAYAKPNGNGFFYRDSNGDKIGSIRAFFMDLPSVWARYMFILAMAIVPVLLFGPGLLRLTKRYMLRHPIQVRLRVPKKGICLLVAFVMLLGPEGFDSLARDEVQYANLGTSTWGQADRTIHYSYDANGSLEKKIIAVTGVADPDTEYIEKFVYSYNLANRLETITHYSYEDLGGSTDDDHIREVTIYIYNDNGIRVAAEYERSVDYYPFDESFELYDQRTTTHLVDSQNHTGYAQTLEEYTDITYLDGSPVTDSSLTTYLIGDDVIAQTVDGTTQYLLYDGHGSTRQLAEFDSTVSIADTYSYDGYGVLLQNEMVASQRPGHVSSQATSLLYAGEYLDTDSQNYYLRARWYDSLSGRFNRMDPFAGNNQDPQSLHKYLYAHCNPINGIDPSGRFLSFTDFNISSAIRTTLHGIKTAVVFAAKHKFATSVGAKLVLRRVAYILFALAGYSYYLAPTIVAFIDMNLKKETLYNPSIDDIREKLEAFKEAGTRLSAFYVRSHGSSEMMYWNDILMFVSSMNELLLQHKNDINNPLNLGEALQEVLVSDGTVILGGCGAGRGENSLGQEISRVLPGRTVIAGRGIVSVQVPLTDRSFFGSNIFKDGELKGTDWGFYGY